MAINKSTIKENLESKLARYFGVRPNEATEQQIYQATVMSVKDILTEKRSEFHDTVKSSVPKRYTTSAWNFWSAVF